MYQALRILSCHLRNWKYFGWLVHLSKSYSRQFRNYFCGERCKQGLTTWWTEELQLIRLQRVQTSASFWTTKSLPFISVRMYITAKVSKRNRFEREPGNSSQAFNNVKKDVHLLYPSRLSLSVFWKTKHFPGKQIAVEHREKRSGEKPRPSSQLNYYFSLLFVSSRKLPEYFISLERMHAKLPLRVSILNAAAGELGELIKHSRSSYSEFSLRVAMQQVISE